MKILLVSDIHSNFEAFKTVLNKIKYDFLVCLGDIISFGPCPNECLEYALEKCDLIVLGNHDKTIMNLKPETHATPNELYQSKKWDIWTRRQIKEETLTALSKFDDKIVFKDKRSTSIFIHNITDNYVYEDSPDKIFLNFIAKNSADFVFFGHSHVPFIRKIGKTMFINTGSIGQARINEPLATCALYENNSVEILKIPYDYATAIKNLEKLPLHPEYVKMWQDFFLQGNIDVPRLQNLEKSILKNTNGSKIAKSA